MTMGDILSLFSEKRAPACHPFATLKAGSERRRREEYALRKADPSLRARSARSLRMTRRLSLTTRENREREGSAFGRPAERARGAGSAFQRGAIANRSPRRISDADG